MLGFLRRTRHASLDAARKTGIFHDGGTGTNPYRDTRDPGGDLDTGDQSDKKKLRNRTKKMDTYLAESKTEKTTETLHHEEAIGEAPKKFKRKKNSKSQRELKKTKKDKKRQEKMKKEK